jgi:Pretoxin HINT domain
VAQLGQDSVTQVWTYFDRTGKNELKTVNHVFKNNDPEITYLTLESKKGSSELITTTPEHPFYVSSSKIVGPQQRNLGKNWVGAEHVCLGPTVPPRGL